MHRSHKYHAVRRRTNLISSQSIIITFRRRKSCTKHSLTIKQGVKNKNNKAYDIPKKDAQIN